MLVAVIAGLLLVSVSSAPLYYPVEPGVEPKWMKAEESNIEDHVEFSFRVALKQQNLDKLEQILDRVSNPDSPHYGKYLTAEQIGVIVAPGEEVIRKVEDWLHSASSHPCEMKLDLTAHFDYLQATTCAGRASEMFGIELSEYNHPMVSKRLVRSAETFMGTDLVRLQVPVELHEHIDMIKDVSELPPIVHAKAYKFQDEPGDMVTPVLLKKLYNIGEAPKKSDSAQSSQAVAEFEEAYFYESDLDFFQANFSQPLNPIKKIVGPNTPDEGYLGEATLDVEYITTVSDLDTWVFSQLAFDLTQWANNVTGTKDAPLIHSISWGSPESKFETATMQRDNTEFMKMGVQGFTVLVASGDEGTGSKGWIFCEGFDPTFPATSPYVTTVGGTYLSSNEEIAWQNSGGGFSNVFARPSYQDAQVANYLSTASLPDKKYFNATGRAIPDVAGLATNYDTVIEKYWGPMSGTSASSPVFAGLLAMINAHRELNSVAPLGFVNPLLYSLKSGVGQDITSGENKASNCAHGFKATAGWDPATGLGTPNYAEMLKNMSSKTQVE